MTKATQRVSRSLTSSPSRRAQAQSYQSDAIGALKTRQSKNVTTLFTMAMYLALASIVLVLSTSLAPSLSLALLSFVSLLMLVLYLIYLVDSKLVDLELKAMTRRLAQENGETLTSQAEQCETTYYLFLIKSHHKSSIPS